MPGKANICQLMSTGKLRSSYFLETTEFPCCWDPKGETGISPCSNFQFKSTFSTVFSFHFPSPYTPLPKLSSLLFPLAISHPLYPATSDNSVYWQAAAQCQFVSHNYIKSFLETLFSGSISICARQWSALYWWQDVDSAHWTNPAGCNYKDPVKCAIEASSTGNLIIRKKNCIGENWFRGQVDDTQLAATCFSTKAYRNLNAFLIIPGKIFKRHLLDCLITLCAFKYLYCQHFRCYFKAKESAWDFPPALPCFLLDVTAICTISVLSNKVQTRVIELLAN